MIATQSLELRAGARLLVSGVTIRINHGDRIGFVGRNGAGKSTLAKVLAGEAMPAGGQVLRSGAIGYLPKIHARAMKQAQSLKEFSRYAVWIKLLTACARPNMQCPPHRAMNLKRS